MTTLVYRLKKIQVNNLTRDMLFVVQACIHLGFKNCNVAMTMNNGTWAVNGLSALSLQSSKWNFFIDRELLW